MYVITVIVVVIVTVVWNVSHHICWH